MIQKIIVKDINGEVIAQTVGKESELASWLQGDLHKYPAGYVVEYVDMTAEIALQEKIELGAKEREDCTRVLDLVRGYNRNRGLTAEQITEMMTTLSPTLAALSNGRGSTGRYLISLIQPDGVLVTQEMKDAAISILAAY